MRTLIYIIMVLATSRIYLLAFNNSILLGCMGAGCLINNFNFGTEGRYIIFYILQGIARMKYINGSGN